MSTIVFVCGLLAGLLLNFISSVMEIALYRVSRVRMRLQASHGSKLAARVLATLDSMETMVAAILVESNMSTYASTYVLAAQLTVWNVPHRELLTTAVITPLFFVLTESLPKQLAFSRPEFWSLALIRVFSCFRTVFAPAIWLLNAVSRLLRRLLSGQRSSASLAQSQRTLLQEHLNAGVADKVLTRAQNRMAAKIMEMEAATVSAAMLRLAKLTRVPAQATRAQALAAMRAGRSRFALLDDAAGVPSLREVTIDALLRQPAADDAPAADAAERLFAIDINAPLREALALFRARKVRRALVTRRGRVEGIVTSTSILGAIAGR